MPRWFQDRPKEQTPQQEVPAEMPVSTGEPTVEAALDALISAKTWHDALEVLEAQESLLLSDDTRKHLLKRIAQRQKNPSREGIGAKGLLLYLRLLDEVRAHGIDAGWDAFYFFLLSRRAPVLWAIIQALLPLAPRFQRYVKGLPKRALQQGASANSPAADDQELDPRLIEVLRTSKKKGALFLEFVQARRVLKELDELEEAGDEALARKLALVSELMRRTKHPTLKAFLQTEQGQTLRDYANSADFGGDKAEVLEQAIACYQAAAQALTQSEYPLNWATIQQQLGYTYARLAEARDDGGSQDLAILYFEQALKVFTRNKYPEEWALVHQDLGVEYARRIHGELPENQEQAIEHYMQALQVYTRDEEHLWDWANTQWNLGQIYLKRIWGDRSKNLEEAVMYYDHALEFYTWDLFIFYNDLHIQRSLALEELGQLAEAHESLKAVRQWQHELIARINTTTGWFEEEVAKLDYGHIYERDARILLRLHPPDVEGAVEALEDGRAQTLRIALDLDSIDPTSIDDSFARERAKAFIAARDAWRAAQRDMQSPLPPGIKPEGAQAVKIRQERRRHLQERHAAFVAARDAIRQQDDSDFLSPSLSFQKIAEAVGRPGEALLYLVAGKQGGLALAITRDEQGQPFAQYLALPELREEAIINLQGEAAERFMETDYTTISLGLRAAGGLLLAQVRAGFPFLFEWGSSVPEAIAHLPPESGLRLAAQALLEQSREDMYLQELLEEPGDELSERDALEIMGPFADEHLKVELKRSLERLGKLGMSKLADWLQKQQIHKVTIIPYGRLGFFPLPAVLVQIEEKERRFSDLFEVALAPSARVLTEAKERAVNLDKTERPQILAAGNPQPLSSGFALLPCAEAEVRNTRSIATGFGVSPVCCLLNSEVTKEKLITELQKAWLAHLALHGQFRYDAPRQSRLILAGSEGIPESDRTITLDECLSGRLNLVGLRLLVLSACDTSFLDFRAANEGLGIAAGFLQAGAAGVIASLWGVNDLVTYLLMSRFMQVYLDPAYQSRSPAWCLAETQRWLREEATYRVLATYDPARAESTQQVGGGDTAPVSNLEHTTVNLEASSLADSELDPLEEIHKIARKCMDTEPEATPYANPFYWAAFVTIQKGVPKLGRAAGLAGGIPAR